MSGSGGVPYFHLLQVVALFCPVGLKGNLSLLDTCSIFPGDLSKYKLISLIPARKSQTKGELAGLKGRAKGAERGMAIFLTDQGAQGQKAGFKASDSS